MKRNLFQVATLITVLSILERGLGFFYRVALSRLLGAEGVGLYQIALSVFAVFLTIGSGGIPITVSRFIQKGKAEGKSDENAVTTAGFWASLILTLPVLLLFLFFQDQFSFLFTDKRCVPLFSILLIGLVFSCLYAVIRGRFWGEKSFLLPSLIELIEEAVMVIVGVLLLQRISSPFDGAKKASLAVVISYLLSFSLATLGYFLHKGKIRSPKGIVKPLFSSAIPITAVRTISSLLTSTVAIVLPALLIRSGMSRQDALASFGVVSGMVLPILSMPSTIIGSISLVLVPELSESFYKNNQKKLSQNIERGIFSAILISCFLIPFFFVLGEDVGQIVYSNMLAGEMLRYSCFILLPMSLTMITTGILNAMGFEKQTLLFFLIGSGAMLLAILFFTASLGAYAYPVGLFASYLLTAICNLSFLHKHALLPAHLFRRAGVLLALLLPISLFGAFLHEPCSIYFGSLLSLFFTILGMTVVTLLFYLFFNVFPAKKIKSFLKNK